MSKRTLRLGTRRSALALVQTETVIAELQKRDTELSCEIVEVVTSGDKKQKDLHSARDKKEWIIELEQELVAGRIDVAIHSGKDVPIDIEAGTSLCSLLPRESAFDAYVLSKDVLRSEAVVADELAMPFLPQGACVGTASARRKAQLLSQRPDLQVRAVRGNVPTRLKKLEETPDLHALILAHAGLRRLSLEQECSGVLSSEEMLPAVNQGILAAQFRSGEESVAESFKGLSDRNTEVAFRSERRLIERLEADCGSCVGVFAEVKEAEELAFEAMVFSADGKTKLESRSFGLVENWQTLVDEVAEDLLGRGAKSLLK